MGAVSVVIDFGNWEEIKKMAKLSGGFEISKKWGINKLRNNHS